MRRVWGRYFELRLVDEYHMALRHNLLKLHVLLVAAAFGCQGQQPPSVPAQPAAAAASTTASGHAGAERTAASKPAPALPAVPEVNYAEQFKQGADLIAKQDFDAAQQKIESLEKSASKLNPDQARQLAELKELFEEQRQLHEDKLREQHLAAAKKAIQEGKLDEAATALETLLAAGPTTEQGDQARELQQKIETHRTIRRRLRVGMELLASKERGRAKQAQEILWEQQEVAFPLLLETLQSDDGVLVANTLELLRKFNQPSRTLPAMIAILGREKQAAIWPAAIKELQKVQQPGGGPPLLELALAAPTPERAAPLLNALAGIADPPPETLVALLPQIYQDGPALAAALSAAYRSISINHQHDVLTRRGLDTEVTAEQDKQLNGLAERLQAIIAAGAKKPELAEAAWAAERLAIAMRLMPPQALSGVKVMRATAESPEGPAVAVLDKVWNSVELKTMWRHPSKRLTTVVLDLGAERTVTGIRIWNCNEASGTHRGWKDLEIYVSSDSSPTVPAAVGVVPPAPGLPDTPDYGAILQVPFARGRYVKLQLLSVWRDDGIAGISELEVLGY